MSVSISNLTTAETFSQWVSKTNSLISFANIAMTLDANKSKMVIKGTSTIHDWESKVETINSTGLQPKVKP